VRTFIKVALIVVLVLGVIPGGLLALYFAGAQERTDQFYRARDILQAMRSTHNDVPSIRSESARDALLQHLPLGTEAATAVTALSKEGFVCARTRAPAVRPESTEDKLEKRAEEIRRNLGVPRDMQLSGTRVVCQLGVAEVLGSTNWIVDLDFDGAEHLTNVKVDILNIFL
jgi:hypothetical protein